MEPFRSLKSYKEMHEQTAKDKGVLEAFMAAKTLTRARGILFGFKNVNTKRDKK